MDQNELQHGDSTEDSLFSDAVLYKEIVRKNPDSIPQLFSELKIKEIEQYLARDATSVPSLRQASDAFRRSRKRTASVSNDADVQIIESKEEEEEAPQPPAAKKAPTLPLTSSPKVPSVKQTLPPPTTPTAAAATAASASPTMPLSVKKAKSSRPTMSPADKEAAMKRKAELAEEREQKKKEKELQRLEREQQKKEREEKLKQKEEERQRKKEELVAKKQEEEERRLAKKQEEDEKRLTRIKEEEEKRAQRRKEEEVHEEKKRRETERFKGFFKKVEKKSEEKRPPSTDPNLWYKPFQVKDGMTLAPILRRDAVSPDVDILEHHDETERDYIYSPAVKHRKLVSARRNPLRAKLFQFSDNYRPPYYGTWRKKSKTITGRTPWGKDENLDYEYDSDDEWEAEPSDAEECKSDEEDDDGGSDVDDEENDGFFVEPFYLSEGEGDDSESEKSQEIIGIRRHKKDPFDSSGDEDEKAENGKGTGTAKEKKEKESGAAETERAGGRHNKHKGRDAETRKARLEARAKDWDERVRSRRGLLVSCCIGPYYHCTSSSQTSAHQQTATGESIRLNSTQEAAAITNPDSVATLLHPGPGPNLSSSHSSSDPPSNHPITHQSLPSATPNPSASASQPSRAQPHHPSHPTITNTHIPASLSRLQAVVFAI